MENYEWYRDRLCRVKHESYGNGKVIGRRAGTVGAVDVLFDSGAQVYVYEKNLVVIEIN